MRDRIVHSLLVVVLAIGLLVVGGLVGTGISWVVIQLMVANS